MRADCWLPVLLPRTKPFALQSLAVLLSASLPWAGGGLNFLQRSQQDCFLHALEVKPFNSSLLHKDFLVLIPGPFLLLQTLTQLQPTPAWFSFEPQTSTNKCIHSLDTGSTEMSKTDMGLTAESLNIHVKDTQNQINTIQYDHCRGRNTTWLCESPEESPDPVWKREGI